MVLPIFAVRDAEASVKFYMEVLEFSEMFRMPGESVPIAFAMLAFGQGVSLGLSHMEAPEPKGLGCVLMLYVPEDLDIDAYYDRVRARGANIAQEIADEYWGDRAFGVHDPDGFYLKFCKAIKRMDPDEIVEASKA